MMHTPHLPHPHHPCFAATLSPLQTLAKIPVWMAGSCPGPHRGFGAVSAEAVARPALLPLPQGGKRAPWGWKCCRCAPPSRKRGRGGVPAVPCPTLMPKVPCAKVHLGRFPAPNLTINQINGIFLRGGQVWVSQGTAMGVCAAQCAQSHIPTAGHTHGPWPRDNVCTLKVPPNPSKPHSSAAPALVRKE